MENYQLGRRVLDCAEGDPEHFSMDHWVQDSNGGPEYPGDISSMSECGMTACLGGYTMLLSGYTYEPGGRDVDFYRPDGSMVSGGYAEEVRRLLGMTWQEEAEGGPYRIWVDPDHGLDRFRALVERSEAAAQDDPPGEGAEG